MSDCSKNLQIILSVGNETMQQLEEGRKQLIEKGNHRPQGKVCVELLLPRSNLGTMLQKGWVLLENELKDPGNSTPVPTQSFPNKVTF